MDTYLLYKVFLTFGICIAVVMFVLSIRQMRKKLSVRHRLIVKLADDKVFFAEIQKFDTSKIDKAAYQEEMERMQKIIAETLKKLEVAESGEIEAPMHQSSQIGRARYIEKIARDVKLELRHAA